MFPTEKRAVYETLLAKRVSLEIIDNPTKIDDGIPTSTAKIKSNQERFLLKT